MNAHAQALRPLLQSAPSHTASALAAALSVSQPTLSRAIKSLGEDVLAFGQARRRRYALRRDVRGLGSQFRIWRIAPNGMADEFGALTALPQGAFHFAPASACDWLSGEFQEGVFPDLPWFLNDLRPQGFLGRAFARNAAQALLCPQDPRQWQPEQCLHALLAYGDDLPGDLVIGAHALERAQVPRAAFALDALAGFAEQALAGLAVGSSAAGEQAKIALNVLLQGQAHACIAKFSSNMDSVLGRRVADLLEAEAIAATLLAAPDEMPAQTYDLANRRFLIAPRFDRTVLPANALSGRRGLVSLASVDSAYFGGMDNWASCAERLAVNGWLNSTDAHRLTLRYQFGRLIGNSDMHFGNCSLHFSNRLPFALTPNYDMLPMHFMPRGMELPDLDFTPPHATGLAFEQARTLAQQFWRLVSASTRISDAFKVIAERVLARF